MPRLTVGLPLLNSGRYLREALDSVRAQTFTDWILLALDDASTDDTAAIVKEYAEKDSRIRLIQYGPTPVPQAENWSRVIQLAETEYVSMFGHDDIMMPDLLAREIRMMDDNPQMAMVFAQGPLIDEQGELLRSRRGNPILQPNWPDDRVLPQQTLGPQLICEGSVHPSSVMLRTKVAQSIPLFADMPLYLDIEYWSRVGDCGSVGYMAGDLLRYRVSADSAYARCIRAGTNLSDAHRLFERMMAHWQWNSSRQAVFKKQFYAAHAARALRAAEMARDEADNKTARLQMAICLSLAETAQSNPQECIARWLNMAVFRKRFSSPRRLQLLTALCSLPILKGALYRHYAAPLPRGAH
jgi:glycosyltransferase involved in cell wall biosynthesis